MADDTIQRLAVLIEANTKQYAAAMTKLEKDTQRAIGNSTKAVNSLNSSIASISGTTKKVAGLLGVSLGARAFAGWIKGSIDAGAAIGDLSQKLGITAEQFQELSFVASQSGTDQDALMTAFRGMTKLLGEAAAGSKEAKAEFTALGLSFTALKGQAPVTVFETLLDTIGRIQDPIQRNAELMKVFSKSGADMAQIAKLGAGGIEELRKRAHDLGIVLSNDTIAKMKDTNDKLDEVGKVFSAAGAKIAEDFMPAINALATAIESEGFQSALRTTANVIATIVQALSDHPVAAKILAGGIAGFAVGGPVGAVVGAGAVGGGELLNATVPFPLSAGTQAHPVPPGVLDAGTITKGSIGGSGPVIPNHVDPEVQAQIDATKKKYDELTASLQREFEALYKTDREQAIANAQAQLGLHATDSQKDAIGRLEGKLYDAQKAMAEFNERAQFFGEVVTDSLSALILRGEDANDVLKNLIDSLAEAALQATLLGQGPLASLFGTAPAQSGGVGGLLGALFGGFRAAGGPVSPGKAYMVNENTPNSEIFVPRVPGTIVPANSMHAAASVIRMGDINITMERSGDAAGDARQARAVADLVRATVRDEIGRQSRPGGLMNGIQ